MTADELSNLFDTQIAAHTQNVPLNIIPYLQFDEYEKSLFLTKALNDLVYALYTGKNQWNNLFDVTEEDKKLLNSLLHDYHTTDFTSEDVGLYIKYTAKIDTDHNIIAFVYETCVIYGDDECTTDKTLEVVPIIHDEINKILNNPFRGPSSRRVLRIDAGSNIIQDNYSVKDTVIELYSKYSIKQYNCRYLKYPDPIILVNLIGTNLSIHNKLNQSEYFDLKDSVLYKVVDIAVQYAIQSKQLQISK